MPGACNDVHCLTVLEDDQFPVCPSRKNLPTARLKSITPLGTYTRTTRQGQERKKKLLEKMQENGPERERDRKAESKVDTNERNGRLLALNHPESGGAIYTEETPGISPRVMFCCFLFTLVVIAMPDTILSPLQWKATLNPNR